MEPLDWYSSVGPFQISYIIYSVHAEFWSFPVNYYSVANSESKFIFKIGYFNIQTFLQIQDKPQ